MKNYGKMLLIATGLALALPSSLLSPVAAHAAASVLDGSFMGAGGKSGSGRAQLVRGKDGRHKIAFSNFSVSQGPNLRVWLVKGPARNSASVKRAKYVELGKLKSNRGAQSYAVDQSLIDQGYTTVVIWCKPFGVLFASARLT